MYCMWMVNRSPDDVNITPAFQREGFGRQSMSEKRKGHIDPKSLDLYQKLKQGKDKTHFTYGRCFSQDCVYMYCMRKFMCYMFICMHTRLLRY